MPVAQHDALERIATKRGLKGKERDRFVFGIMRKSGWKPKRELNALLDDLIQFGGYNTLGKHKKLIGQLGAAGLGGGLATGAVLAVHNKLSKQKAWAQNAGPNDTFKIAKDLYIDREGAMYPGSHDRVKKSKVTELSESLDGLIEFKIQINPDNKGKFTATKKKTGKTTTELKHSKNALTRKRANFAEVAKKWGKNRKKQMSAETQPIEFSIVPAPGKLTKPHDIADRMRHILRKFNLKKKPSTNCLSAKLDEIIKLGDTRPRNSLGEYTEQQEGVADPNSMAKTYAGPIVRGLQKSGTTIAAGAGGAVGGLAVKEVYDKIKRARK